MKFQVPQFIETETKIIGPFTLKQFLWIGSGVAMLFLAFLILRSYLYIFVIVSIPIVTIFGSLAFIKIEGAPLFNYLVYGLAYFVNPKKYFFGTQPQKNNFSDSGARKTSDKSTIPGVAQAKDIGAVKQSGGPTSRKTAKTARPVEKKEEDQPKYELFEHKRREAEKKIQETKDIEPDNSDIVIRKVDYSKKKTKAHRRKDMEGIIKEEVITSPEAVEDRAISEINKF